MEDFGGELFDVFTETVDTKKLVNNIYIHTTTQDQKQKIVKRCVWFLQVYTKMRT
jgi:hypothetical protein